FLKGTDAVVEPFARDYMLNGRTRIIINSDGEDEFYLRRLKMQCQAPRFVSAKSGEFALLTVDCWLLRQRFAREALVTSTCRVAWNCFSIWRSNFTGNLDN